MAPHHQVRHVGDTVVTLRHRHPNVLPVAILAPVHKIILVFNRSIRQRRCPGPQPHRPGRHPGACPAVSHPHVKIANRRHPAPWALRPEFIGVPRKLNHPANRIGVRRNVHRVGPVGDDLRVRLRTLIPRWRVIKPKARIPDRPHVHHRSPAAQRRDIAQIGVKPKHRKRPVHPARRHRQAADRPHKPRVRRQLEWIIRPAWIAPHTGGIQPVANRLHAHPGPRVGIVPAFPQRRRVGVQPLVHRRIRCVHRLRGPGRRRHCRRDRIIRPAARIRVRRPRPKPQAQSHQPDQCFHS